jgi:hypothetical protein
MTEEERYQAAWRRRKLWERLDNWLNLPAYFVLILPFLYFSYHKHFPTPFIIFGSVWLGAGLTAGYVRAHLRCPRCNHRFSVAPPRARGVWYLSYCANCGLPEGAQPGDSVDPAFVAKSN